MALSFEPPAHPPPLLSDPQLFTLARQGHLPFHLPPSITVLLNDLSSAASSFFDEPTEVKSSTYPAAEGTELGYYLIEGEKEYISLRHLPSPGSNELERKARQAWHDIAALLHRVLADLAFGLAISHEAWDPLLDGCLTMPTTIEEITPTLFRLFRYYPDSGTADKHVDNGLLTLCVGNGKGLQVLNTKEDGKDGEWHDVQGPTILAGSMLQVLSGNRVKAGVHRVVSNPTGRSSLVLALRPSLRHPKIDHKLFGGEGVLDIDKIYSEIKKKKFNVNAQKHLRQEQREALRASLDRTARVGT